MKKVIILLSLLMAGHALAQGQIDDPNEAARWRRLFEQRQLVDLPTAGMLVPGSYAIDLRMFAGGGVLGGISVGLTPSFMFGVSYGGEGVIGEGDVDWNPDPGVFVKIRLVAETYTLPAIAVGFDSQGFGRYQPDYKRYEYKSRGIYVVTSKNYAFFRNLGLHGGLNWSPEGDNKDDELNLFIGADVLLNPEFRLAAEYDVGTNDNEDSTNFGSGNGFLNMSLQWLFQNSLFIEFGVKNFLKNGATPLTREIKVGYYEIF